MDIIGQDKQRIEELVAVCKKSQGEHLPSHHGSGSWATTYSHEFKDAAAEICSIVQKNGHDIPFWIMSRYFRKAEILSCRGAEFTSDIVKYLYKTHLINLVAKYK